VNQLAHVQTVTTPALRKSRPEDVLANVEARLEFPLEEIASRIRAVPNTTFSELSVVPRIEAALAENRRNLDGLPNEAEVDRLANIASEALATSTPAVVKREVANLIGAFPNAAVANPEIFLAALVFDLLDKHVPDGVVVATCRRIRRTQRFVPTISEVLEAADTLHEQWRSFESLSHELRNKRSAFEAAIERGEKTLALVQAEIAEGYRTHEGMIVRRRIEQSAA
jgi:hypothetical protein